MAMGAAMTRRVIELVRCLECGSMPGNSCRTQRSARRPSGGPTRPHRARFERALLLLHPEMLQARELIAAEWTAIAAYVMDGAPSPLIGKRRRNSD